MHNVIAFAATFYVPCFPFQGNAKLALGVEWVVQLQVSKTVSIGQDDRKVTERKDSETLRTRNARAGDDVAVLIDECPPLFYHVVHTFQ